MGWIGISIGISLFVLCLVHYNNREYNHWGRPIKDWINADDYIVGGVMSLMLSLIFVALFGSMIGSTNDGRDITAEGCVESVYSRDIVSAVRDKEFSSNFILGTGGGRTVDTYYVYRQDPKGMMLANYNAHRTYVVEQDGTPRYERVDTICPQPIYDFLWWSTGNTHLNRNRYGTLYVPENTILREFRL